MKKLAMVFLLITFSFQPAVFAYHLADHPRMFVNKATLPALAANAKGPLAEEYKIIKETADKAVRDGIVKPHNRFVRPMDMVCAAICHLVEQELGNDTCQYIDAIKKYWGDGEVLNRKGDGSFGYYGLVYDWIYDALSEKERKIYGDQLGQWLRYYTDVAEITLKSGHWWYNQTWGPAHLNTPNTRDGITPKLLVALALKGAGTIHEEDAVRFLDSWAKRVPAECIPAFDESGGVWTESMGHGGYGPIAVIPWAFEAWYTATGEDLFSRCAPTSYMPEMTRWAVHLTVPFCDKTAWIDDNRSGKLSVFSHVAPILAAHYYDPVANGICEQSAKESWIEIPWTRLLCYKPAIKASNPGKESYPTAHLFKAAGHVYMRSDWNCPDATWAFFGAGPKFAGHSRDDEGSFLLAKKGWLVLRAGGQGHNDGDYYIGGSLAYNIVTIYNPEEKFRRTTSRHSDGVNNENDGGLIRYVYTSHTRDDRAEIKTYHHDDKITYTAADLTIGYRSDKVSEVTRQFLYLRGKREFIIIFDRIDAANADFPKTWFLHTPSDPTVNGTEKVLTADHVFSYTGDTATWLSNPAGEENVISSGKSRAFLKTLLPKGAKITKRGGEGHEFWGHPHEPTAQYNHTCSRSNQPPIVPWRLEVEAPIGKNKRDYFLHVLEIGDESDSSMSNVSLVERDNLVGVSLKAGEKPLEILFAPKGAMNLKIFASGNNIYTIPTVSKN